MHHDTDGYFFKGNVENNYVWFGNRMFRVLRVYNDNSVKLVGKPVALMTKDDKIKAINYLNESVGVGIAGA